MSRRSDAYSCEITGYGASAGLARADMLTRALLQCQAPVEIRAGIRDAFAVLSEDAKRTIRCALREAIGDPPKEVNVVYMAVIDTGEHSGRVVKVEGEAWPAPGGWTYQDVTGPHATVLCEDSEREIVERRLDVWLGDGCPKKQGGWCFTHGGRED